MTTEVSCYYKPFYLTVKFINKTFVVTSGLYRGFGNLVVI